MEKKEQKEVSDIEVVGEIELPKLDLVKWDGKKVVVEDVKLIEGVHGYYYLVESLVLESIGEDKNKKDIRASTILGLHTDSEGQVGWGVGTKTYNILKKYKIKAPKDLKGMEMLCVVETKNDKEFLRLQ